MKNFFYFILILLFTSCKSQKESLTIHYENELGTIEKISFNNPNKPLLIIIPSVYGSLINEIYLAELSKNYRVVVVYYLSHQNITRQQQLDGLANRLNYYSTALSSLTENGDSISYLVGEGINANIATQLAYSFSFPKLGLINAWHPNLQQTITAHCLSQQSVECDSLTKYLSFSNRTSLEDMMRNVQEKGTDTQQGNFTSTVWQDFLTYNTADLLSNYKKEVVFIYTTNSGLLNFADCQELQLGHSKRRNTQLLSVKDFYKNVIKFSK